MVALGGVEDECAQQFAGGGVDDADVEVLHEDEDVGSGVGSSDAVTAGLTSTWSSGQVEGQNTRVKLIKRLGYGRANFDLLRKRILPKA